MRPTVVASLLCLSIGALLVWWGGRDLAYGIMSAAWPLVDGRVVESGAGVGGDGVVYRFRADGEEHRASRIRFGRVIGGSAPPPERVARDYPPGRRVDVRYLPQNPSVAVLEPGLGVRAFIIPGVGAVLVTIGSGLAILSFHLRRIRRAHARRRSLEDELAAHVEAARRR